MTYLKQISVTVILLTALILTGCQQINDVFYPVETTQTSVQPAMQDTPTDILSPTTQVNGEDTTNPQQDSSVKEGSSLIYTEESGNVGSEVSISISLPQFSGDVSESINKYLQDRFDVIKASALSLKDVTDPVMGGGIEYEYGYRTQIGREYITVVQNEYSFVSGGAHPSQNKYADNFNTGTGARVQLAELFKDKANYARILAERCFDIMYNDSAKYDYIGGYSRNEIEANLKALQSEVTDACFAAIADDIFIADDSGITLIFNPYEIAPYAMGIIEVTVPWADVKEILR